MNRNGIALLAGLALFAGATACGGDDAEVETTTREVVTEPDSEEVEITVPTVDTSVVERTVETEVDVDTIEEPKVEGTDP